MNARGLASRRAFRDLLSECLKFKTTHRLAVICLQEHNLDKGKTKKLQLTAKALGYTLHISFGRPEDVTSARGGVLILTADDLVDVTTLRHNLPGHICIEIAWGTKKLDVSCTYAPATPLARVEFLRDLRQQKIITPASLAGGDWNCVPDTALDVISASPLGYAGRNHGAQLLETIMQETQHSDVRRDQLGNEVECTRTGNTTSGWTSTRLDRWYTPKRDDLQWTVHIISNFVFKKQKSDHAAVMIIIEDMMGDLGKERITLREDIMEDRKIQVEMANAAEQAWKQRGSPAKRWVAVNNAFYKILLRETKRRRKTELLEIKQKTALLEIVTKQHKQGRVTDRSARYEKHLYARLHELKHPTKEPPPTQQQSLRMTEKSDMSSKALFRPFKGKNSQQWVNGIKKNKWEEGKDPVWNGVADKPEEIGEQFMDLYQMIFAEKEIEEKAYKPILKQLGKKKILKHSRQKLEKNITLEEVTKVMENLPTGKQPGPNRIPNAVYKYLSKRLAPMLAAVLNHALVTGKLPDHFLEGDISVLYKNKGDRDDPRNYRPITLLNTDYKIFTRILASRMRDVVHQFVAECQKGFVPDVFIAEATALLKLVEAYINEDDEEDRKGVLLFLDMEKAFDRVSYEFTMKGLEALGFGNKFRSWVGQMYDVDNAPKRRFHINGWYTEWFQIKSGVAQGCPLSPLLFLIVAEALKISLDMEKKFKGIKIGDKHYKLIQFADDTAPLIGDWRRESKYVDRGLRRWCKATGMRENTAKREAVALGAYRGRRMPAGPKWVQEGQWCKHLGVPIGNDLAQGKWWGEKINVTRQKTHGWVGLQRMGYYGRSLPMQGMYYGRLRYWLYSLYMNKRTALVAQHDADVLAWAKDPKLQENLTQDGEAAKSDTKVRRWIAQGTAPGPKNRGGVSTMIWCDHVDAILAQWIIRYLQPGDADYKILLDHFLLRDKRGKLKYPEGRGVLLLNLSNREKHNMIHRLPTKATYWRECLKAFWRLKLKPKFDGWELAAAESPWHGHRIQLSNDYHLVQYCKHVLNIKQLSDFYNSDTNARFRVSDWMRFIDKLETERDGVRPTNTRVYDMAFKVSALASKIPQAARDNIKAGWTTSVGLGDKVYLIRGKIEWPAIIVSDTRARRVRLDATGKAHETQTEVMYNRFTVSQAVMWGEKWAGPKGSFGGELADLTYTLLNHEETEFKLERLVRSRTFDQFPDEGDEENGLQLITKTKAKIKMKTPPAEAVWKTKVGPLPWPAIWRIRADYVSPRDKISWMKVRHRTLWVAKSGGMNTTSCAMTGCVHEENIEHLVDCTLIRRGFWTKIEALMRALNMNPGCRLFWLFGLKPGRNKWEPADPEEAAMISWAWRALYAEVTRAHIDDKPLDINAAYARFVRLAHMRLQAYGYKWYRWYSRQQFRAFPKVVPLKHRQKKLIESGPDAEYLINPTLSAEFRRTPDKERN